MTVEGHATDRGKPDPNHKPPPAVARAAARSEELAAAQKAAKEGVTPQSDAPKPPAPPADLPLFKAAQAPVQPAPPTAPEPPQPPQPSPADFEHQFRSLKGRYDRAEEDNRRLAAQLADTQRLFATLQTAPLTPPQNPQAGTMNSEAGSGVRFSGPIAGRRYVQPKEEQEYGPELIDVMGRRTMEVVEPVVGQLQAEIAGLKRMLGGVQRAVVYSDQEKMYTQLKGEVPNWSAINEHPEFHKWLSMPDPMSGQSRQDLLSDAYKRNEASRVAHVFKTFLVENGYAPPLAPSNGNGGAASTPQSVDISQYAAPGRPKTGSSPSAAQADKPVFTGDQIKQFYADSAAGRYKGRDAEYNAAQQAIFEAMRENRIKVGK